MGTKRVQAMVSVEIYKYLQERSKNEGRTIGNLAAWLLTRAVEAEIDPPSDKAS